MPEADAGCWTVSFVDPPDDPPVVQGFDGWEMTKTGSLLLLIEKSKIVFDAGKHQGNNHFIPLHLRKEAVTKTFDQTSHYAWLAEAETASFVKLEHCLSSHSFIKTGWVSLQPQHI